MMLPSFVLLKTLESAVGEIYEAWLPHLYCEFVAVISHEKSKVCLTIINNDNMTTPQRTEVKHSNYSKLNESNKF